MKKFRSLKLQHRITIFISGLTLFIVLLTSILFYYILASTIEQQLGKRALHVAETIAKMPEITEAFDDKEPWKIIQPIAERIRIETNAEYIVIGNKEGIRYSHPLQDRLGKKMVGGDNEQALVHGKSYVSKATGSLGPSLRGKVPVFNEEGAIIGVVSVGFMMDDIHSIITDYGMPIFPIAGLGLIVGLIGSVILARNIKKLLLGLEPKEISSLYTERNAVIQSVREGIMVVNQKGHIVIANQAAFEILSIKEDQSIIGKRVTDIVPNTTMLDVLETGEQQFDRQLIIDNKVVVANRLPVKVGEKVIGVVSSFRLKSDIELLTEELSQVKRYTEALRAQTHEYNNLLYTLSGLIQLESYNEALVLIHKETVSHQQLVQFMMHRLKNPWLGGILLGFHNRAKELKIDFEIDKDSNLSKLDYNIESNYLVSILGNLITNAFEAVEKLPNEEKKVRVYISDVGEQLLFEVEDSGKGIDDEIVSEIFRKGFSTKDGEDRGFGLDKVKSLLEERNGYITVENGDLGGALFVVSIPLKGEE
ncbi:ATP-binding protein [Bacillus suaedaesalsae]|uniref:histidine kinase n=1 Tax=Bacillus suaedaesalsae TaxID=2810349 RepID=A0ABS2DF36_9BACI|nr:sensor histidine kinase [Bacillus suaedaesalsae]MBM6617075.1 sensor histidine kinase [Bacillus suaedaesalsae]